MADNQILPFALTDTGSNLLSQGEYESDHDRFTGNRPGIARSALVNKTLKQTSLMAAAVAEFMARHADAADPDVSDMLSVEEAAAYLQRAVSRLASLGGSGLPDGGETGQALVIGEDGPEWRFVSGDPVGTIIAFAGKEAPKGFISINYGHETAVPVAAYPDLLKAVYCGDDANDEADFFYRAMDADGSERAVDGTYLMLPAASKYFLRGRDANGEVEAYRYQGDAIRNITASWTLGYTPGGTSTSDGAVYTESNNTRNPTTNNGAGGHMFFDASRVVPTDDENRPINFPVLWCIKAWDAAAVPSDMDVQALVNYWSELCAHRPGMDYHDGMTKVIYPKDGSEDAPAILFSNERVVIDNPFPGYYVYARPELFIQDNWSNPCFSLQSSDPRGARANQMLPDDTIVVQSGQHGVTAYVSNINGSAWGNQPRSLASAPFRVLVTRLGRIPS